ncbi:MAG: RidA family protein, partial [Planctomycetota bacterium]
MNQTDIESVLGGLGLVLPSVTPPVAAYVPARVAGDLVFVSGQLPVRDGTLMAKGVVPTEVDEATA